MIVISDTGPGMRKLIPLSLNEGREAPDEFPIAV